MTNDPKGFCLTCGNGPLHPDGIHSCRENPVLAHLKARIAELEAWVKETNSLLRGASNKIVELIAERDALQDPGTAAAMRVLLEELPGLMNMNKTDGPWEFSQNHLQFVWGPDGDAVCKCEGNLGQFPEPIHEEDDARFIVAARNAIHRAAQAKREAEKEAHP